MRTKCSCASVSVPGPPEKWTGARKAVTFCSYQLEQEQHVTIFPNDVQFLAHYANTPRSCGCEIHTFPVPRVLPNCSHQCFSPSHLRSRPFLCWLSPPLPAQLSRYHLLSWASPPSALQPTTLPVSPALSPRHANQQCGQLMSCFSSHLPAFQRLHNPVLPCPRLSRVSHLLQPGHCPHFTLQVPLASHSHSWSPFSFRFLLNPTHPLNVQFGFHFEFLWLLQYKFYSPQN